MSNSDLKTCVVCDKEFQPQHFNAKTCPDCVDMKKCKVHGIVHHRTHKCPQCNVEKSHIKYTEANTDEWIECPICGYRASELGTHITKFHKLDSEEFRKQYNMPVLKSKVQCDRVKGSANPGYQHGGKLSVFSKNFLYADEDKTKAAFEKAKQSREENSGYVLTIDYWLKKTNGNLEEAQILFDEEKKRHTFTLEKCIEKYGKEEGYNKWKERQDKWQNTLKSKSAEEIEEINRKKSNQFNYKGLWTNTSELKDSPCIFYILDIGNDKIKVGITTVGLGKRYNMTNKYNIIKIYESTMSLCFQLEQIIKKRFKANKLLKEDAVEHFGWTESFYNHNLHNIIETCNDLIYDNEKLTSTFKNEFNLSRRDNF